MINITDSSTPTTKIPVKLLAKIIEKIVAMFPASNEAKLNYRL